MPLAEVTTTTTFGIWAIVIVAVSVLAFWLTAVVLADRSQARASGRNRPPSGTILADDESWAIVDEPAQESATTRADIPVQRSGQPVSSAPQRGPAQGMPTQRAGEADRAERSGATQAGQDDTRWSG